MADAVPTEVDTVPDETPDVSSADAQNEGAPATDNTGVHEGGVEGAPLGNDVDGTGDGNMDAADSDTTAPEGGDGDKDKGEGDALAAAVTDDGNGNSANSASGSTDESTAASGPDVDATAESAEIPASDGGDDEAAAAAAPAPDETAAAVDGEPGDQESSIQDVDLANIKVDENANLFVDRYPSPKPLVVPDDMVAYSYSYGYECCQPNNLVSLPGKVAYSAGKVVVIHDLESGRQTYIPSTGADGVGAIALHPKGSHLAVGEKGDSPIIAIYTLPDLKLVRMLKNGTQRAYSCLAFNAGGDKIASVGSSPDYMLTVWNWAKEATILRSKAFSSDVFRVSFAAGNDGQLTTCGAGHIRFWKMAETFTGLKLQGDIGKFGKAEISDVRGCAELPDGKVVSGSEWGNMLLWEGGKIKCEIAAKGKKGGAPEPIHAGGVDVVLIEDGEVVTAGADGHIRIWDLDVVDLADAPSETNMVYLMDPQLERKVGNGVQIVSMSKSREVGDDDELSVWYAQDQKGSVWKVDIAHSMSTKRPQQMMRFHGGPVVDVSTCPVAHVMVTIGDDGATNVYDYTKPACEPLALRTADVPGTCVLWAPKESDSSGRTFWAGYADGVLRVFNFSHGPNGTTLVLNQAWKPHNAAVRSLAVSHDGRMVITASASSIFFFANAYGSLEPTGYFDVDDGVKIASMSLSKDDTKLLVACSAAKVLEVAVPKVGAHDVSSTYKLTGLNVRAYKFSPQLDKINKAKAEAARPKKSKKEDGDEGASKGAETSGDNDDEAEEAKEKAVVHPPPAVTTAWYTGRGTFMVTLDGREAEYVYECSFDMEEPSMHYPNPNESTAVVRQIRRICQNDWLALLADDGSVRFHDSRDFMQSERYVLHNAEVGGVAAIAETFDRSHLITTGHDGNIFVMTAAVHGVARPLQPPERELDHISADTPDADDITSSEHYSIEDEKQKAEADRMAMTAEEKKAETRRQIRMLRKEFETLLKANKELPVDNRLGRESLEMDPEIARRIETQEEARRAQYTAEMAWTVERHTVAHEKMRTRFLDRIQQPTFVVKCIRSNEVVSTYRIVEPSNEFQRISETMMNSLINLKMQSIRGKKRIAASLDEKARLAALAATGSATSAKAEKEALLAKEKSGKLTREEQQRLRRIKRQIRKEEWAAFNAEKPDPEKVSPEDEAAVEHARTHMGDYKLKTSRDYVIPPEERVNTEKKREQIVALRRRIYDAKNAFNAYCNAVRSAKLEAIEELKATRGRLIDVLSELGEPICVPLIPECDDDEFPERKMEYSEDSLRKFKIEYSAEQKAEAEAAAKKAKGAGGFGGLGGGGDDKNEDGGDAQASDDGPVASARIEVYVPSRDSQESRVARLSRSPAYKAFARKRLKLLADERDQLVKKFDDIIFQFDRRVQLLLEAKRESELRIKFAEFQHVVYYQELVHLKSFDLRESKLQQRRDVKYFERRECISKAENAATNLKEKKSLIKDLEEKMKENSADFARALGENNKNERYLTKVFKKKIKRKRKEDGEGSDEESSEESSDDEDYDSEDDDEDFDDTVAPPGCSDVLFERVLGLREVRLDCEEALADERKTCEVFRREVESCNKKEKTLTQALEAEDKLLTEMQLEKQGKLNELDTAVPLRLSQILDYRDDLSLNKDLSSSLVFPTSEISNLKDRIAELEREKSLQKEDRRKIKKEKAKLQAEKYELETVANELERKLVEIQMLKFGSVVDLEALESRGEGNRKGQELLRQLRELEDKCARQIKVWDEKVWQARQEFDDVVVSSTSKISKIGKLSRKQETLNKSLAAGQEEVLIDDTERLHASLDERMRLQDSLRAQAEQIEVLRYEIAQLSRKDGRVLPPSKHTDPLPPITNS
mmetsp:Transcript_24697/g.74172  ORF Transcript_24697/g.74172 Transcript_24697/m.74172 type:complete len:1868 (-) Transcript_24697:86-5689(-)